MAIDFAMSISTGRPWHGRATERGMALYVSGEGSTGIGKRAHAWLLHHKVAAYDARVAWLTQAIPVYAESDSIQILLRRIQDELRETPTFVIIDTLARCFDGDENAPEDMGAFIQGVDQLRQEFDATVMVIHHTRLDGTRERGHTSFKGACDTMISLTQEDKTGVVSLTCAKQKDWEDFVPISLKMLVVPEVQSCVMVTPEPSEDDNPERRLNRSAQLLEYIEELQPISFTDLRTVTEERGMAATTMKRALNDLKVTNQIYKKDDFYRVLDRRLGPP